MSTLRITKEGKTTEPTKMASIYLSTHKRLAAFSEDSGIPHIRVIKLCVDFALDNVELIDPKSSDIKAK